MDNYSDLDMTTLTELPDLSEVKEIPLDSLVNRLEKLRNTDLSQAENLWKRIWRYLEKVLIFLILLGLVMLALWLKVCRGKISVRQLVRALGSRKIKAADTKNRDTVTDPVDAESVQGMGAGSTEGQPVVVRVREVVESGPHQMAPLVLDLASEAHRIKNICNDKNNYTIIHNIWRPYNSPMHVYIMMMMMIMTTIVKPLISRVKIVALYVKKYCIVCVSNWI